jgi:hypothetical protein
LIPAAHPRSAAPSERFAVRAVDEHVDLVQHLSDGRLSVGPVAVDVGLGRVGEIVVEDVGQAGAVETARRKVYFGSILAVKV